MEASFLLLNNSCRNDRTVQGLLPWYPVLQLTPPGNPNIFFTPSSELLINLWALQCLYHHGVNPAAPFPIMIPLYLSQNSKEQTVFSDLPAAQRGRGEPIAAGARASYGNCTTFLWALPLLRTGRGSQIKYFHWWKYLWIHIFKNPKINNNLSSKHLLTPSQKLNTITFCIHTTTFWTPKTLAFFTYYKHSLDTRNFANHW